MLDLLDPYVLPAIRARDVFRSIVAWANLYRYEVLPIDGIAVPAIRMPTIVGGMMGDVHVVYRLARIAPQGGAVGAPLPRHKLKEAHTKHGAPPTMGLAQLWRVPPADHIMGCGADIPTHDPYSTGHRLPPFRQAPAFGAQASHGWR